MSENNNISKFDSLFKEGLKNHTVPAPPASFMASGAAAGAAKIGLSKIIMGVGLAAIIGAGAIYYYNSTDENVAIIPEDLSSAEPSVSATNEIEKEAESTVFQDAQKELDSENNVGEQSIVKAQLRDGSADTKKRKSNNLADNLTEYSAINNEQKPSEANKNKLKNSVIDVHQSPIQGFISMEGNACFGEKVTLGLKNSTANYTWYVNDELVGSNTNQFSFILENRIPYKIHVLKDGVKVADTFIDLSNTAATVNVNIISDDLSFLEVKSNSKRSGAWFYDGVEISSDKTLAYSKNNFAYPPYYISKSEMGCMDTFFAEIKTEKAQLNFVSEIFTPNNDGLNDVYDIDARGCENFMVVITDASGKVVFESFDPKFEWKGVLAESNVLCPEGWYSINVSYTANGSDKIEKRYSKVLLKR